jgi:tetratricopeptide (TPR) repeat protein
VLARLDSLLRKYHTLSSWLLILVGFAAYRGVLSCGYVYDDVQLILQNPFIKNPHLWTRIFLGPLFSFEGTSSQGGFYRPLTIFSYWLVCRVAGLDPAAYHLFLLALYALSIWIVYRLGRKLLQNDLAAFAGATLWALNPLHVEVVAWVSSMSDIGCTLFYLLGFWMFLRAEDHAPENFWWHVAAAAAYFPALFFKEMAFSFPLLLLAYWFCNPSRESWLRRVINWIPYAVAVGACAVIRVAVMGHFSENSLIRRGTLQVAWAALGLLGKHAKLFFWPVNLSEFRDFNLAASLRSPWPWAVLLVIVVAFAYRHRNPRLSFLVLWWMVALLPTLNYRQLTIPIVADRFSYTASVGLCLAVGYLAFDWLPRRFPKIGQAWVMMGALAFVAAFWTVQTVRTIPHWRNNDALFDYSLRISPNAAEVHQVHGVVLQFRENDLDGAAREFRTALRLDAQSLHAAPGVTYNSYIGLGQVALLQGRDAEALEYFNKAVHLSPGSFFAYDVLGSVYFPRQDYARAAGYFQRSVQVDPQDVEARFYLGSCWMKMGKPTQAAEQFHSAREVDPTFYQAYVAEAAALAAAGDKTGAARVRASIPKQ